MEKEHILKERTFIYDLSQKEPDMNGCYLDIKRIWVNQNSNEPCIQDAMFHLLNKKS